MQEPTLCDLASRADLELLLRAFYSAAFEEPLLRSVFVDVVHMDLEAHLPVIIAFWQKVLFDDGSYSGRTMEVHRRVHRKVALTEEHFVRWLDLWSATLAAHFSGPVAAQADAHARRMAPVFLRNLATQEPPRSLPITVRGEDA